MPSITPTQLSDAGRDAETIADIANSPTLTTTDRLGRVRRTLQGVLQWIQDQASVVLGGLGYLPPVAYASGIAINNTRQTVTYQSVTYAANADAIPFTTSGTFETAKFRVVQGVTAADLSAPLGSLLVGWLRNATGAVARTIYIKAHDVIHVRDWGIVGDGSNETAKVLAMHAHMKTVGGTVEWDGGKTYCFSLDLSGNYKFIIWRGNGAEFRAPSTSVEAILYADNSGEPGGFLMLPLYAQDCNVIGRLFGSTTEGDINYAAKFKATAGRWKNMSFQYGKVHSYYGMYHQYGEFDTCLFGAANGTDGSAACQLDSDSDARASNENAFWRPKFFSSKNGLWLRGGIKNRIYSPTVQDMRAGGNGGIVLDQDNTGFFCEGTLIHGGYGEINAVPHIFVSRGQGTTIDGFKFLEGTFLASVCLDLRILNCEGRGSFSAMVSHPSDSTQIVSLTTKGNNFKITKNLDHPDKTVLDCADAATGLVQQKNLLVSTGNIGPADMPYYFQAERGVRSNVLRNTTTQLFRLTPRVFSSAASQPFALFDIRVLAINGSPETSSFAYSEWSQTSRVRVSRFNNVLHARVKQATDGLTGSEGAESFTGIGLIAISADPDVSGTSVVISATYAGMGTTPDATARITIGYRIDGLVGNDWVFTPLGG